ncbi:NAD(P)-dependent oxidoreductase [Sunxiuqinia sp. A32]|uniref:NAD(P)-dependent oxidoreductase n=1 Tax=Sunxiuqinia sp. A32 TaxID=3461496 RepID=UPI004045756A
MKVGILRETRRWDDRRVAITPETAKLIHQNFPDVELVVQASEIRIHRDDEYREIGISVVDDVSDCDVLIGVKEVSDDALIEGKTYFMFSHVAKEQEHNRQFLKEMSRKRITLIDYEYLTDTDEKRVVAFGFWAGVVGTYYAFKGIAKRFAKIEIPGPDKCLDLNDLHHQLRQFEVPPIKIVVTGGGRVASGSLEIIRELGIQEVLPRDFLYKEFEHPVFIRLDPEEYVEPIEGNFDREAFFKNPKGYRSAFLPYTKAADVFIPCHFWNPESPVFFTKEELREKDFAISIIADISCDVPGPIPTTIRSSTIDKPFYDIEPASLKECEAFSSSKNVTVMAVDNLPTALPVDASRTFARDLYYQVFSSLFGKDEHGIIERATILKGGKLTESYSYLKDFLEG